VTAVAAELDGLVGPRSLEQRSQSVGERSGVCRHSEVWPPKVVMCPWWLPLRIKVEPIVGRTIPGVGVHWVEGDGDDSAGPRVLNSAAWARPGDRESGADPPYDVAVALRVVGPGQGRTGTYSLKLALERLLGGRCHHMAEIVADPEHHLPLWAAVLRGEEVDWEEVFAGYVAQTDFPGAAFWPELSAVFPDAFVVLSTRPAEEWYRSAASTIFQLDPESSPFIHVWRERFGFTDRLDDAEAVIAAYEQHNARVRSSVPPHRFLEWTVTDGWAPLCDRLGLPVPDEPFPWTNTTTEFRAYNRLD
jgi:Sulfotransferase domain